MSKRKYKGDPIDGTMTHITERDLEDLEENVEEPGQNTTEGDMSSTVHTDLLTKKQKIAKTACETGIIDYRELYEYIENNCEFDTSEEYVYQVIEQHEFVENLEIDKENGTVTFDDPYEEIKQAIVRKARLNDYDQVSEIHKEVMDEFDVDIRYHWVRRVVNRNTDRDKRVRDGSKKNAIINVYRDTGLVGENLVEEVEDRTGLDVSKAYARKLCKRGFLDGYIEKLDEQPNNIKQWVHKLVEEHNTTDTDEIYSLVQEEAGIDTKRAYVAGILNDLENDESEVEMDDETGLTESDDEKLTAIRESIEAVDAEDDCYTSEEIENQVLKPIKTAQKFAGEEQSEALEEAVNLVQDLIGYQE